MGSFKASIPRQQHNTTWQLLSLLLLCHTAVHHEWRAPLSVGYEDPDLDNLYFNDRHIGEDDDDEFKILQ